MDTEVGCPSFQGGDEQQEASPSSPANNFIAVTPFVSTPLLSLDFLFFHFQVCVLYMYVHIYAYMLSSCECQELQHTRLGCMCRHMSVVGAVFIEAGSQLRSACSGDPLSLPFEARVIAR